MMLWTNGCMNKPSPGPGEARRKWPGGVYTADNNPSCRACWDLRKSVEDTGVECRLYSYYTSFAPTPWELIPPL